MANYKYEALVMGDLNAFVNQLDVWCDKGKGRVISSNAYYDKGEQQTMYYALVQIFDFASDNPDSEIISQLNDISTNTGS